MNIWQIYLAVYVMGFIATPIVIGSIVGKDDKAELGNPLFVLSVALLWPLVTILIFMECLVTLGKKLNGNHG